MISVLVLHSEINFFTPPLVEREGLKSAFPPQCESCMPLPWGTDQVSVLIVWCLEAHARWQPGLNMHDDAVEKEEKK